MPKFIIERDIPGAGKTEDWSPVAQGSCAVLHDLGPQIQWVQSYVTADRVYVRAMPPPVCHTPKHTCHNFPFSKKLQYRPRPQDYGNMTFRH